MRSAEAREAFRMKPLSRRIKIKIMMIMIMIKNRTLDNCAKMQLDTADDLWSIQTVSEAWPKGRRSVPSGDPECSLTI